MSILITAASHAQAYKLERLLQLPDVIFGDFQEMPPFTSGRKFIKLPRGNSASYAHEVLDLALNSGIERIFPLYQEEILPLAESRQLFGEYGISVIVPSLLWLRKPVNPSLNYSSELLVLENGKVLSGKLSEGILLPEENFSGIFLIESDNANPAFKLFTV